MTINARADEDVEPDTIMDKVAKASGANYNFHKEGSRFQDSGPQAPVVSSSKLLVVIVNSTQTEASNAVLVAQLNNCSAGNGTFVCVGPMLWE